ncbi:MAG: hypothetical protein ACLQVN_02530 [Bryobacteraceae bacterium]
MNTLLGTIMLRDLSDLAETILVVDSNPMGVQLQELLAAGVNHAPIDYATPTRDAPPRKPAGGEA